MFALKTQVSSQLASVTSTVCWPDCVCEVRSPLAPLNPCHRTAGHLMRLSPHQLLEPPSRPSPFCTVCRVFFLSFALPKLSPFCSCTLCELNFFLLFLLGSNLSLCIQTYSVRALFTYFRSLSPLQELRITQPLAHRLLTQLSVWVSFLQMDKNWSRFGPWWVFVRHVAYFSLR